MLTEAPRIHEDIWGNEYRLMASLFLTSALEGDEWSASRSGHFVSEESSGTILIRGLVSPRAGVDDVEKTKICLSQE